MQRLQCITRRERFQQELKFNPPVSQPNFGTTPVHFVYFDFQKLFEFVSKIVDQYPQAIHCTCRLVQPIWWLKPVNFSPQHLKVFFYIEDDIPGINYYTWKHKNTIFSSSYAHIILDTTIDSSCYRKAIMSNGMDGEQELQQKFQVWNYNRHDNCFDLRFGIKVNPLMFSLIYSGIPVIQENLKKNQNKMAPTFLGLKKHLCEDVILFIWEFLTALTPGSFDLKMESLVEIQIYHQ